MIYVNKVENLAGGPTRGMPRRCFRTLVGLTTPTLVHARSPHPSTSPTPTPANRSPLLTVLGLRYFIRTLSLSLSRSMFRRNNDFAKPFATRKGGFSAAARQEGSLRRVIKGLGGCSKRNCNYGWLLLREKSIFFFLILKFFFQFIIN